jgi:hypothetical protein
VTDRISTKRLSGCRLLVVGAINREDQLMSPEAAATRGRLLGLFPKLPECLQQAIPALYVQPAHFFEVS